MSLSCSTFSDFLGFTSEILTKTELVSFDGKSSEFGFNVKYEMGGFGLDVGGCGIDLEDGRYVVIGTV